MRRWSLGQTGTAVSLSPGMIATVVLFVRVTTWIMLRMTTWRLLRKLQQLK